MPDWHTYENGLCFWRLSSGKLCTRKDCKEVRDIVGNAYGLFCREHIRAKMQQLINHGVTF